MTDDRLNWWEEATLAYLHERIPVRVRGKGLDGLARALAPELARLTLAFNHDRGSLSGDYLKDPRVLSAYVAQFGVLNAHRVLRALSEAPRGRLALGRAPRVLDLGCGTGAASAGAIAAYCAAAPDQAAPALVLVDRGRHAVDAAGGLLAEAAGSVVRVRHDLALGWPHGPAFATPFDLILATHVAVELGERPDALAVWIETLAEHLTPSGMLLILEPATQQASRRLMACKPLVSSVHTLAPCPHDEACPLHAHHARDWCHVSVPFERSSWLERLDRLTGLDHAHLAYSYWLAGPQKAETPLPARIVSDRLKRENGLVRLVCRADASLEAVPAASLGAVARGERMRGKGGRENGK